MTITFAFEWWKAVVVIVVTLALAGVVVWLLLANLMPTDDAASDVPAIDTEPSTVPVRCSRDLALWEAQLDEPADLEAYAGDFTEWEQQK